MCSNNPFSKKRPALTAVIIICALFSIALPACGKPEGFGAGDAKSAEVADGGQGAEAASGEALLYMEALDKGGNSGGSENYEITKVRRGDFNYEMFAIGSIEYRDLYYETMETEEAKIIEYKVKTGDKVDKGDVILEYEPVYDEAGYNQKQADIAQKEKEYAAGHDARQAEILAAERELEGIKDKNEREIKQLEVKKLKLALKEYEETSESFKEQKDELEEYKAGMKKTRITASHSGYIMELAQAENENILRKGNIVAVISPKKDYYIKVDDTTHGMLRYNADVTISVAAPGGDVTMPGKVVMCSNILTYGNATEDAYVEILEEPEGVDWSGAIKIYFESKAIKDVLLLDSRAVLFENKNEGSNPVSVPYAYIYKDGGIFKRYIQVFGSNNQDYLVLSGLDEGQEVAIYNK